MSNREHGQYVAASSEDVKILRLYQTLNTTTMTRSIGSNKIESDECARPLQGPWTKTLRFVGLLDKRQTEGCGGA